MQPELRTLEFHESRFFVLVYSCAYAPLLHQTLWRLCVYGTRQRQ